jgi:hypothetical protein
MLRAFSSGNEVKKWGPGYRQAPVLPGLHLRPRGARASTMQREERCHEGARIQEGATAVGLTVYSAAPFLGLSLSTTYRIARGEYDAPESAAKLLRIMIRLGLRADQVD